MRGSKFLSIRNIMLTISGICLLLFFTPIYIVRVDVTKSVLLIQNMPDTKMLSCIDFIMEDTYDVSSVIVLVFFASLVALFVFLFGLPNIPKVSQKAKGMVVTTMSVVGLILWGLIREQLDYSMSTSMLYLSVKTTPVPIVEYILLIILTVTGVFCSLDLLKFESNLITSISEFFWGISTGMKLERERYAKERQELIDAYSKMLLDRIGEEKILSEMGSGSEINDSEYSISEKTSEDAFPLIKRVRYCPNCGESIFSNNAFCCYCGKDIRKEIDRF